MKTSWTEGDKPTATLLNEYRTALIDAHTGLGDLAEWSLAQRQVSSARFVLLHTFRFLHFTSVGQITALDGSHAQDINEDDSGAGVLDLDSLDWLVYGELYRVNGVTICMEDWQG